MGALHAGHAELLKHSVAENDHTVLSIFVNPTQFNNSADLQKYPRTWETDLALAKQMHVDVVFAPTYDSMYPDNYRYKVSENNFSLKLCGAHRPGHFDGVLSVVMKLLLLVQCQRAYFGEKDYQQLSLIKDMAKAFFLDAEIKPVATVRETDGLAMSSRNTRLSEAQRKVAPLIYQVISNSQSPEQARDELQRQGFRVDYVEDYQGRRFVAAFLGDVRLIDNVEI